MRIKERMRRQRHLVREAYAPIFYKLTTELAWRWRSVRRKPHALPSPLVVSLTSYPPRFATLRLTLKCLLSQTILPDATVLWIAENDVELLPKDVLELQAHGLTICPTLDIGPYKKIIPSLETYADSFIVTADDDVYYAPDWLAALVESYNPADPEIVCHRAHRLRLDHSGKPLKYADWQWEIADSAVDPWLMPTGVGGVLYFPHALPEQTLDRDGFLALSPRADDLWLYWMLRHAGRPIRTLGFKKPLVCWHETQQVGLRGENVDGAGNNDLYVARLYERFGLPA